MEYLSAAQAAGRAGIRPSTVTRWVQSGKLPAQRLASGTLQIAEADLEAFLPLRDAAPRAMPAVALAVAQERIRGPRGAGLARAGVAHDGRGAAGAGPGVAPRAARPGATARPRRWFWPWGKG